MTDRTSYRPGEPSWVEVSTSDLDGSIAFYSALFGWEVNRGPEEMGFYSVATKNGKSVCGITPTMQEGQPVAWLAYINVEDTDKTAGVVADNGGQSYVPPMDVMELGRMAVIGDPTGAGIGLWQPKQMIGADVIQDEGTLAWVELSSRDLQAALPFYRAVFGWDVHDEGGYTHFQLGADAIAGAMDMPEAVPAEVPSFWMPYFAAADPQAQAARVAELGGSVLMPYMEAGNVAFSVAMDPQGASFGLVRDNNPS